MKKKISFVLIILMTSLLFSKSFFGTRYFETKVDVPFNFSNNTLGLFDIFQKELVIDLSKIANEMPKNGLTSILNASPNYGFTLNINDYFILSPKIGLDIYGSANISKSFFDFVGNGNQLGEKMDFSASANADVYASASVLIGMKVRKLRIGVSPQVFIPLYTAAADNVNLTVENSQNGDVKIHGNGDIVLYTNLYGLDANVEDYSEQLSKLIDSLYSSMGFDLAGYFGWDFSKSLSLDFNYQVPIRYGLYRFKSNYNMNFNFETSVSELANGNIIKDYKTETASENVNFKIYRPMKFNIAIKYAPFDSLLTLNIKGGVGVYHPFMNDFVVYPEYFAGIKVSCIGLISAQFSTEYIDRIFSHTLSTSLNLRLVQVDVGFSLSSSDFLSTFKATGVGGFVSVAVGF